MRVVAKTGTLYFASALAGYMTGGARLAFAIFAADPERAGRASGPRSARSPPGANAWAARARAQQQALLRRWAALYARLTAMPAARRGGQGREAGASVRGGGTAGAAGPAPAAWGEDAMDIDRTWLWGGAGLVVGLLVGIAIAGDGREAREAARRGQEEMARTVAAVSEAVGRIDQSVAELGGRVSGIETRWRR